MKFKINSLDPRLIKRLELGVGCENCGRPICDKTKHGYSHCGLKRCIDALNAVGESISSPFDIEEYL